MFAMLLVAGLDPDKYLPMAASFALMGILEVFDKFTVLPRVGPLGHLAGFPVHRAGDLRWCSAEPLSSSWCCLVAFPSSFRCLWWTWTFTRTHRFLTSTCCLPSHLVSILYLASGFFFFVL